ncbi:MAG: ABC transporter permease [Tissierellia bacterium]|nr:ABC transporter permease [Tissierellia bacterium]
MKLKMKAEYIIIAGALLLALIISMSTFAQLFTSYDPVETDSSNRLNSPCSEHVFGTDQMGRDMFSRVLYGGRATILASFSTMFITLAIGVTLGILGGYYNDSILDIVLLRIIDALMGFPFMILAMIITALFGTSFIHLLIAITSVRWIPFARLSRSITLSSKESVGVMAARVTGASDFRIIKKEILPKILSPAFTLATFELGNLILSIAALSFFGLGAKPPTPEWGSILADSKPYFFQSPHLIILPSLFILLTVLALNLIGEGLRDKFETYEVYEI